MGRKLDALLGRKFKTTKLKTTVKLAVSRLTVLKNKQQLRLTWARTDIIQLLNLNHHEHALLRVDQVIKEQNMLDVYVMVDGYCQLLLQMINLIEEEKDCPKELKEAVSSLLYAAPRCGEYPELQEIRAILTTRYGKDFAYGAIELRSNCGVSTKMIQKLSPRQSTLETRMKVLQEIADENDTVLKLDNGSPEVKGAEQSEPTIVTEVENKSNGSGEEFEEVMSFSESRKGKKKFRDVEHAAQVAFESAAYAAAAARAAVELSRSGSFGSDNPDSPNSRPRKVFNSKPEKSNLHMRYERSLESESESESESEAEPEYRGTSVYASNVYKPLEKTVIFDESENENENEDTGFSSSRNYDEGFNTKPLDSGHENMVQRFGEGLKMQTGVHQLDLTKRPISVRAKRVYGQ